MRKTGRTETSTRAEAVLHGAAMMVALLAAFSCSRKDSGAAVETIETVSSNQNTGRGAGLVISQVYGGTGADNALFNRDYVELFNRSTVPVPLAGLSIHFASSVGEFNLAARLPQDAVVPPGGYYLVGFAAGQAGTDVRPDAAGSAINILPMNGKVAIVRDVAVNDPVAALDASAQAMGCGSFDAGGCVANTRVVDLVGYGHASDQEGKAPAPTASVENALLRAGAGCVDNGDNATDFARGAPSPRTSRSPKHLCGSPADGGQP